MRVHLLLTTALAVMPAVFFAAAPASAEITHAGIELAALQPEIAQLESRANDFMVADVYECPPPNPVQLELQALGRLSAKHAELKRRFEAAKNDAIAKVHAGSGGGLAAGDIPDYGRHKFDTSSAALQASYWSAYSKALERIAKTIKAKEDALRRARVIPCKGSAPKNDIIIQPPLPPLPPLPPVQPPKPPEPPQERSWDPMQGLQEPMFTAADIPVPPRFFCSEAEKQAMLARLEPAKAKLQREADAYEAYAQMIEARKAQLASEGMPLHWQNSMDYAARQARFKRDERLGVMTTIEQSRYLIEITPVVDCTTVPKDELKTGWDFKAGVDYAGGKLKFPDSGYLGVENPITTERMDAVIRSAGESNDLRRAGAHVELPIDWAPPNIFEPFGGRLIETRLRAAVSRTSAEATRFGDYNPMGGTLFIPGLTDVIGETSKLPSTFDATVRDNFVDGFRYRGEFRKSEFSFGLAEDFKFDGCDDFTLTKNFGLRQSWTDRREAFRAEVLDYFPFAAPGFDVVTEYNSALESSTTALKLGLDGTYAPKSWNGVYLTGGLDGWAGYTDTDGAAARRLDIEGGVSSHSAEFSKSETTFGYGLRAGVGYDFGLGKIELGIEYRKDGDMPVTHFGAGVAPTISHEEDEALIGVLRTTFTF